MTRTRRAFARRTSPTALAASCLTLAWGCGGGGEAGDGSVLARNKATTETFFLEVMNEGRFDLIDDMFTQDYTLQGQPFPPAKTKAWARNLRSRFPELEFTLDGLIAEGDQVAVWWILDLNDPKQDPPRYSGINLLTYTDDGKVEANWEGDLSSSVIPGSGASAGGPVFAEAWAANNGQISSRYTGDVFQLSADYPRSLPPAPVDRWNQIVEWPLTDEQVVPYMMALRQYVYDALLPVDWRAERIQTGPDGRGGWYNPPWLSAMYTGSEMDDGLPTWCGRDYIRGLYFGTPLPAGTIPDQPTAFRNYEVVFYNDVGGYHLGRVWNRDGVPNVDRTQMPEGTVIAKLVFTTGDHVPSVLEGAPRWTAYLPTAEECQKPALTEVTLIQLDVVVKDLTHAPETGWVFTTFVYDRNDPDPHPWKRMVPLGAMWGDDPDVAPGGTLRETVVNPEAPEWFAANLGFGGRLSGPIDGAKDTGSCLSCHATAEFSPDPDAKLESHMLPPPGTPEKQRMARWFRNLPGDEPWSGPGGGWVGLDYSFVTLGGLAHYFSRAGLDTAPSVFRERDRF